MTQEYNVEKALTVSDCFMKMYRPETTKMVYYLGSSKKRPRCVHLILQCHQHDHTKLHRITGFLQIQPNQFPGNFYKLPDDFYMTSHTISVTLLTRGSPIWVLADIYWAAMLTPEMYTHTHLMALCLMPFLLPNQQRRSTEGIKLPDVQCTENWLTCKNYIAN